MGELYGKAIEERKRKREEKYNQVQQKLDELKAKNERNEISAVEFDSLFSEAIRDYMRETDCLIQKVSGKAWDFSKEKNKPVFALNEMLILTPLTEEFYDAYLKTRAIYAYNGKWYLQPENGNVATSELRQHQALFMALVEVDNIPSQKLMLRLGGRLVDIYDLLFYNSENAERFEEEHLDEITEHMIELAEEPMVEPKKLLSHVLDYRIFAEKL